MSILRPAESTNLKLVAALRFVDLPIQLRAEPSGQKHSRRSELRREIDLCAFDFIEVMMRRRVIEELRDGAANFVEPRPIQIAEHDALLGFVLRGFDQTHLRIEIFPIVAVVNQAIDPGPKLRVHRIVKFALPPEMQRQIGIQMRKDNARQQDWRTVLRAETKVARNKFVSCRRG